MTQKNRRVPQDRQMIKYAVRSLLSGRVFICFLACLIPAVLPWVMQLLPAPQDFLSVYVQLNDYFALNVSLFWYLLSVLAVVFVTDPMSVKVSGFFLTFNRDPENLPSPLSVCDCFGPGYFRLVKGMLLRNVAVLIWVAVPLVICVLIPGMVEFIQYPDYPGIPVIRLSEGAYYFILLAGILGIYRSVVYSMVPYLLADDPTMGPIEAMRSSQAITRGRVWELIVLEFSFFGWILLSSVTLMIASVYVQPYIEGTLAAYYLSFTEYSPILEKNPNAP